MAVRASARFMGSRNEWLVFCLGGAGRHGAEVAGAEFAAEEVEREAVATQGELRVVAQALVAQEGVGAVEFVPGEMGAGGVQRGLDFEAAFKRNVWILAAPDHEEFALDLAEAVEAVVVHALREAALMDVGGVETNGGEHGGIHGGAKCEVSADADAEGAEAAGAGWVLREIGQGGAGIGVVVSERLGGFEGIAAVGAGLVVGEDGAGGFVLVVNLGHGDDEAVAGQQRGGAADGAGDLEYLGVEQEAGIATGRGGLVHVRAHRTGGGGEVDEGGFLDGHGWCRRGAIAEATRQTDFASRVEISGRHFSCFPERRIIPWVMVTHLARVAAHRPVVYDVSEIDGDFLAA